MAATAELVRCACKHCKCGFDSTQGHELEGQLYCSSACATHDHDHPSACCTKSGCCQ